MIVNARLTNIKPSVRDPRLSCAHGRRLRRGLRRTKPFTSICHDGGTLNGQKCRVQYDILGKARRVDGSIDWAKGIRSDEYGQALLDEVVIAINPEAGGTTMSQVLAHERCVVERSKLGGPRPRNTWYKIARWNLSVVKLSSVASLLIPPKGANDFNSTLPWRACIIAGR